MRIKRSLLALTATAMAAMAFASPGMATDGVVRDVEGTGEISAGTALHMVGWTKFTTANGTFQCHATWKIEAVSGSTGTATSYTAPNPSNCTGTGNFNGCVVKTYEAKNLPYHATVTADGRIDITGEIQIHSTYSSCIAKTTLLKFSEITLTPLRTGGRVVTGTENRLGETAALNEPIAGFEVDGAANGTMLLESIFGGKEEGAVTGVTGEFELTSDSRCTYEISAT